MNLTMKIFIGMILGIVVGAGLKMIMGMSPSAAPFIQDFLLLGVFEVGANLFIASLKMLVAPLVFVSLICGVTSLKSGQSIGFMGVKTMGLYLLTTAVAISLAICAALIIQPGAGANLESTSEFAVKDSKSLVDVFSSLLPTNPIMALAEGNMLQVITFAILLGLALTKCGEHGRKIADQFHSWNEVIMKLLTMLMNLAPYGIFCLLVKLFADKGLDQIDTLIFYFGCVVFVLLLQALVIYPSLLVFFARLNPFTFLAKMRSVQLFAFSTASSSATMPITLKTAEEKLGVDNSVASFTVPLGATINMDGTAIMQGVATVFIAQAFGIDIGITGYLTVVLMATLASIGTAGVPGVGLITLSMVLSQVGLPVEGIGLIIGVDRLLDMMRTAVNVTGDATVTCVVARTEGEMDQEVFNDPEAGLVKPV